MEGIWKEKRDIWIDGWMEWECVRTVTIECVHFCTTIPITQREVSWVPK